MSRTVQLYNLGRALRSQSEYAKRMNYLSASIFGEVRRPTDKKSMKLVTVGENSFCFQLMATYGHQSIWKKDFYSKVIDILGKPSRFVQSENRLVPRILWSFVSSSEYCSRTSCSPSNTSCSRLASAYHLPKPLATGTRNRVKDISLS